ncbi:MAG: ATP-grasp domain-containing protein [Acidimicrobiales bacterium]|nr:ATP-grasp domain-containing protein [Acidimicrobiales bacterium]
MRIGILLHPRNLFVLDLYERIHDVTEAVWVVDSAKIPLDPTYERLLRRLGPVADLAGLDPAEAADCLGAFRPDGVVTFVDDTIERTADLAARLDLPYHTPAVASLMVDKRRQREVFEREGLPSAAFWPVPDGLHGASRAAFAQRVTYPSVLKPVRGSGSLDIQLVEDPGALITALGGERIAGRSWIVEEYIPNTLESPEDWYANYLSVESVVSNGELSHIGFCGRFPLAEPFRETGNFMPALVPPGTEHSLLELVEDAVRALGIRDSVLHTEIKLTADGPRLIEINGRLGGRPPFVLEEVSPVNLFAVTCQVAGGVPVKFEHLVETSGVGFWLMLHGPISARRVVAIEGLDRVAALDGVKVVRANREAGSDVDWRTGTDGHVVVVRGRAPDHRALADVVAAIRRSVVMTFESR